MNIQYVQELVGWAAPKTWPNETVASVAELLYSGTSAQRVARILSLEAHAVARVQRVLRAAGVRANNAGSFFSLQIWRKKPPVPPPQPVMNFQPQGASATR